MTHVKELRQLYSLHRRYPQQLGALPETEVAPVQVGDIAVYKIAGRMVSTFQTVQQVNAAGDVLTDKDGWIPAGSFRHHRPLPESQRPASPKDWNVMAAGYKWHVHGRPLSKEVGEAVDDLEKKGKRRVTLERKRTEKNNAKAVAKNPLFPLLKEARYTTVEAANEHVANIRSSFIERRRSYDARTIVAIRQHLRLLPEAEVARLNKKWQARQWASGLVYLISFLHDEEKARRLTILKPRMAQLKAQLQAL